jgi:hypothetical protein
VSFYRHCMRARIHLSDLIFRLQLHEGHIPADKCYGKRQACTAASSSVGKHDGEFTLREHVESRGRTGFHTETQEGCVAK